MYTPVTPYTHTHTHTHTHTRAHTRAHTSFEDTVNDIVVDGSIFKMDLMSVNHLRNTIFIAGILAPWSIMRLTSV